MEAYIWLILGSMLAVGVLIGFMMGRSKGDTSLPRVQELEEQLKQADEEMQAYRGEVGQHFEKTATLFNQLTNNYREVYEHLASSSEQLCGDQVSKLKSLTSDSKVLEGKGEEVVTTAEPATEAPAQTEAEPAAEEKPAAQAEATEEQKVEVTEEEAVPPQAAEASTIDQQAAEARTIH